MNILKNRFFIHINDVIISADNEEKTMPKLGEYLFKEMLYMN